MGRIAPDGYDVLVYMLNETTGTFINTGTAGSTADWTLYGGALPGVQGIFDDALYIPGNFISNNKDGAQGGSDVLINAPISISGWVFLRRYTSGFANLFEKKYFQSGWTSPFLAFGLYMNSSANGSWITYITLNGVLQSNTMSVNDGPIPQGRWCHVGGTWDGTTLRSYLNGTLVRSTNFSGTLDYGSTPGPWFTGAIPDSGTTDSPCVIVQDIRVANVARPQSYFAEIYYNGFTP